MIALWNSATFKQGYLESLALPGIEPEDGQC